MTVRPTRLPGVLLVEPRVFGDARGFFLERFETARYADAGIGPAFVQDNHSRSQRGVLRGLHFQREAPQGKLIEVARGRIWDVVLDLRLGSPTFGEWEGHALDDEACHQLWVPPGFAHGFCVLSDVADVLYKCTAPYRPADEGGVAFDDPALAIAWPVTQPTLSDKDRRWPRLAELGTEGLPQVP